MPSATLSIFMEISSRGIPLASDIPTILFLLRLLEQVAIRSPMPANPEKVNLSAPRHEPSRDISDNPLVMIEALALSPRDRPSEIPVAIAVIFLREPPISTPIISVLV